MKWVPPRGKAHGANEQGGVASADLLENRKTRGGVGGALVETKDAEYQVEELSKLHRKTTSILRRPILVAHGRFKLHKEKNKVLYHTVPRYMRLAAKDLYNLCTSKPDGGCYATSLLQHRLDRVDLQ